MLHTQRLTSVPSSCGADGAGAGAFGGGKRFWPPQSWLATGFRAGASPGRDFGGLGCCGGGAGFGAGLLSLFGSDCLCGAGAGFGSTVVPPWKGNTFGLSLAGTDPP